MKTKKTENPGDWTEEAYRRSCEPLVEAGLMRWWEVDITWQRILWERTQMSDGKSLSARDLTHRLSR